MITTAKPDADKKLQEEMLLLLATDSDVLSEQTSLCQICTKPNCSKPVMCDKDYKMGFIVLAKDWKNDDFVAIYGEAVQVNTKKGDVRYIDEDDGVICVIHKGSNVKCVARIHADLVRWI
jgi:hypothetical protein